MNRLLYILLISAITIIGFTMYKQNDAGHISIGFANFSFETNLIVSGAAILSGLFLALMFVYTFKLLKSMFVYSGSKRQLRLKDKSRLTLAQGLIEYAEGRYEQAEKILLRQIKYSENRLLVYLTAARAAQQLGAHDRRDDYLQKALNEMPAADIAISLTKAELQLAHDQKEQALATLTHLYELSPQHTYVLTLLVNTYKQLQDWDKLEKILPQLKKHGNFSAESLLSFEIDVCKGKLSKLTERTNAKPLIKFWNDVPSHLKTIAEVVEHYAKQLVQINASSDAEYALRQHLNKNWVESSIILYSELDVMADNKQLETIEGWLKEHSHDAYLLLALANICISRSLWGKARGYLEASISINPMPENYLKLARLLEEHMNETSTAQNYYRQGLLLLTEDPKEKTLAKIAHGVEHKTPRLQIVKT